MSNTIIDHEKTVQKIKKYMKLLDECNDELNNEIRYHRNHKYDREADYLEIKRKLVNEVRMDLRSIVEQDLVVTKIYLHP